MKLKVNSYLEATTQKYSDGKKINPERISPIISNINLSPTLINKVGPGVTTMDLDLAQNVIFVVVNTQDSSNG